MSMQQPHAAREVIANLERLGYLATQDSLRAMMRDIRPLPGARIIFTPVALRETNERLFPESRHRSRRVLKKLLKRYGGEFRMAPCLWRLGDVIYAHPAFRAQIEAATKSAGLRA